MNKRSMSFQSFHCRSNSRGTTSTISASNSSSSTTTTIMDVLLSFKATSLYCLLVLLATARILTFNNINNRNTEVVTLHHHHHVQPLVVVVTTTQQQQQLPPAMVLQAAAIVEMNVTDSTNREESNNPTSSSSSSSSSSSASISSSNHNNNHVVVIHAGPHKTASTTIQGALMKQSRAGTLLADGYETLGQSYFSGCPPPWPTFPKESIKNHATLAFALQGRCPNNETDNDTTNNANSSIRRPPLALLQLSDFLSTAFSRNHSIILSTEEFAQPYTNLTLFYEQLHQFPDTNVTSIVILYYRRLLEWIPSIYFEIHKKFQKAPTVFPSFVEWLNMDTLDNYLQLYMWAVKERFEMAGFDVVKVLPMQKTSSSSITTTTDTTVQFICDHVPGANQTCSALSRPKSPVKSMNQGTSLEYDRIVVLAFQAGLVSTHNKEDDDSNEGHKYAVQRLQAALSSRPESYQQKYKICLPENVRIRLLELALFFEDKMACGESCNYGSANVEEGQESNSMQQEEMKNQLRAEFAALLESEKLCSWDAQLLLQEEEWIAFFQSL